MALLIFGSVCNLVGLVLVLGAGRGRPPDGVVTVRNEDEPEFAGAWPIAIGGFLIIIGSAITTMELVNRFA